MLSQKIGKLKLQVKKLYFFVCAFLLVITFSVLLYSGILWPNKIFSAGYAVHGIDVSNHQGKIDWDKIAQSSIKFVYIKATEGKDYKDKYFQDNWYNTSRIHLYKGAYHYFTIKSPGIEQARNFVNTVPVEKGCLPPVIDIEENGLEKEEFKKQLFDFIDAIEKRYNQKPVLYVVYPLYKEYIQGDFEEYPIWIRDVFLPARLKDNRKWMFWQYCDRGRTDGIDTFIDLNVFNGKMEDLRKWLSS